MKKKDKNSPMEEGLQQAAEPVRRKKKRKKAPIIIGIVVILILVVRMASCALTPAAGAIVTTVTAQRGDLQESISTSGTVESEEVEVIFAPVAVSWEK